VSVVSQCGLVRISCTSDENVCDEETNKRMVNMMYSNILDEIERITGKGGTPADISTSEDEQIST